MTTKTTARATTRDLGLAIRDFLEGRDFLEYGYGGDGDLVETGKTYQVQFIDVSDANNPRFHLDNGQTFVVRIIAGA